MNGVERISGELRDLGFSPDVLRIDGLGGAQAAVIDFPVAAGRFKGRTFKVGIAFQEEGYPEYPPHFVWVAGLPASQIPTHSTGHHHDLVWSSFSVPPNDFWDRLPMADKNMKTYVNTHLLRFWNQV